MANQRNPNPRFLLLVFLLFGFSLIVSPSFAHFSPIDNHLLDCGSWSGPTTLDDRRVFVSDSPLLSSGFDLSNPNPNPNLSPLYRTARVFTKPTAYELDIQSKGTHLIRLHFYPFFNQIYNFSHARFDVVASGFVLLNNFGVEVLDGALFEPQLKEYFVNLDSERLVIAFVPADSSSFAFVNAIEVVSAPKDLIGDVARLVKSDKIENFDAISRQAMETVYRINVGGPKVTPYNDTLWRTWVPDSLFLMSSSPSKIVNFSGRIMYRKNGATREVGPDNVYNSARTSKSNMTWAFAVDRGYKYLIRMHFCDIASLALNELYFDVYVNGYIAYKDLDISDATGQVLASPYYVDFVVDAERSGLLNVGIVPSKFRDPLKVGGQLNGLEILKLNNSIGSLDGESSVVFVLEDQRTGSFVSFMRSLACGFAFVCLLATVSMLVLRLRSQRKDFVPWSRLPVDISDAELVKGSHMVSMMSQESR